MPMETKTCTRCRRTKPVADFYRTRTGTRPECKECRRYQMAMYRARRQVLVILAREYGLEDAQWATGLLKGKLDGE